MKLGIAGTGKIDNHETANADQYMQETIEAMKIIALAAE